MSSDSAALAADATDCDFCGILRSRVAIGATNPYVDGFFDVPFRSGEFVAFPDAAPLGPGHVLVVPDRHVLSAARLDADARARLLAVVHHLASELSTPDGTVPWVFEHGSSEADESAGCGITHAHFHLVFCRPGVVDGSVGIDGFRTYPSVEDAWRAFRSGDYYLLGRLGGDVHGARVRESGELKCSMFLRKLIARRLGRPELADYRRYESSGRDDLLDGIDRTYSALARIDPAEL